MTSTGDIANRGLNRDSAIRETTPLDLASPMLLSSRCSGCPHRCRSPSGSDEGSICYSEEAPATATAAGEGSSEEGFAAAAAVDVLDAGVGSGLEEEEGGG
jgi:hypothetical protein